MSCGGRLVEMRWGGEVLPLKGEAAVRPAGEDRNDVAVTPPSDRFAISSPFRGRT